MPALHPLNTTTTSGFLIGNMEDSMGYVRNKMGFFLYDPPIKREKTGTSLSDDAVTQQEKMLVPRSSLLLPPSMARRKQHKHSGRDAPQHFYCCGSAVQATLSIYAQPHQHSSKLSPSFPRCCPSCSHIPPCLQFIHRAPSEYRAID